MTSQKHLQIETFDSLFLPGLTHVMKEQQNSLICPDMFDLGYEWVITLTACSVQCARPQGPFHCIQTVEVSMCLARDSPEDEVLTLHPLVVQEVQVRLLQLPGLGVPVYKPRRYLPPSPDHLEGTSQRLDIITRYIRFIFSWMLL